MHVACPPGVWSRPMGASAAGRRAVLRLHGQRLLHELKERHRLRGRIRQVTSFKLSACTSLLLRISCWSHGVGFQLITALLQLLHLYGNVLHSRRKSDDQGVQPGECGPEGARNAIRFVLLPIPQVHRQRPPRIPCLVVSGSQCLQAFTDLVYAANHAASHSLQLRL